MNITITKTWQGFVVGGGHLPAQAAWGIFDNYGTAHQFATELARDIDLPIKDLVPTRPPVFCAMCGNHLPNGPEHECVPALMRRQAE